MKWLIRWVHSFRFAYEGIQYALSSQPNMKFHFFVSFFVLTSAIFFHIPKVEILFIMLAITLVIVTELINTAVEKTVDLAMPDRHPLAKIAKDVAAAAVLVCAVFAVAVGMIVFYEPVDRWLHQVKGSDTAISGGSIWLYLLLVLFTFIVVETRFSKSGLVRPSLWTAISFSISTLIALLASLTAVILLSYTLSCLFLLLLYEKKSRSLPALLFGALIGSVVTLLAFRLNH